MQETDQYCLVYETIVDEKKSIYDIYIDDFTDYNYYKNAIQVVREAKKDDIVRFLINSGGGDLRVLDGFLSAIEFSECNNFIAEIIGEACSAAAVLALACPVIKVYYTSRMLIHSFSLEFLSGKLQDSYSHLGITKIIQEKIADKYYKGFLTDKEIEDVVNGKEIWIYSDDIVKRLSKRNK